MQQSGGQHFYLVPHTARGLSPKADVAVVPRGCQRGACDVPLQPGDLAVDSRRRGTQTTTNQVKCCSVGGFLWGGLGWIAQFFRRFKPTKQDRPPPNHQFEEKIQSLRERRSSWSQKNRARKHEAWLTSIHQPLEKTPLARPPP